MTSILKNGARRVPGRLLKSLQAMISSPRLRKLTRTKMVVSWRSSWTDMRALKRLSHRDWSTLRDLWVGHLPDIDLETIYPEPTLWQLPAIAHPPLNASGIAEFPYVAGVRESIFREAVLLTRKFIYCATLLPALSGNGKNTWTAVTAYETAFYGAKAFCYLLGFASLGRSSDLYLDAFCETERKVEKQRKKFYETLRVHKFGERLTHEVLWALTARLIDTTTFQGGLQALQTRLKLTDWDTFTKFRNKILYDGSFWPLHDQVANCDIVSAKHRAEMVRAARLDHASESSAPFAEEYFLACSLFRGLILGMLQSISEIAPSIASEVRAFDVLQNAA